LKESKKAIKFYSPSKYPIEDPPIYKPTFCDEFKSKLNFSYNLTQGSLPVPDTNKYSDKLQFYHLKASHEEIKMKSEKLIFKVKSINSLITFVNNENLIYNELSPKVRMKEIIPFAHEEDDTTDFSRLSKVLKNKQDQESFHYFPNLSQAPELELPNDLPELSGIADDITFSISDQELIAPSLGKMNIINELPNVEELVAESSKKSQDNIQISKTEEKAPAPPAIPINIPPPPPPIPISIPSISAPPPPPVPPMMSDVGNTPKPPQPDDMRSNLMAAIRNAGGKSKLRSVPAADEQAPNTKKKPIIQPAGDLMSDLHAKLAMRRRGIAGTKEAKKEKSSILDKVSSLIPPPKADDSDSSSDSASNNDTDWD
jgi:WAS protein family homolog 1